MPWIEEPSSHEGFFVYPREASRFTSHLTVFRSSGQISTGDSLVGQSLTIKDDSLFLCTSMYSTHTSGPALHELAKDADVLTMGVTPSANRLHHGHYLTLFNLLTTISHTRTASARIFVDDREFNNQTLPCVPSITNLNSIEECIRLFVQLTSSYLHNKSLSSRVKIQRMSDFLLEPGFDQSLMNVDLFTLLRRGWGEGVCEVYLRSISRIFRTFCPDCSVGKLDTKGMSSSDTGFNNVCNNESCMGSGYEVNVLRGHTNWCVHYALVGLRDIPLARRENASVVHIYGGDYSQEWGTFGRESKAERMSAAVAHLQSKRPSPPIHHYVGPLILRQGAKLSKSKGDYADYPDFKWYESVLAASKSTADFSD